jgi:hypothetical protein
VKIFTGLQKKKSAPPFLFQGFFEGVVKGCIISQAALENDTDIIDVFHVNDNIYTLIKGGHIVHSPEPAAQQSHKNLSPRAYIKIGEGIQHYVVVGVFRVKILVQDNHIINVEPHIF